MGTRARVAEPIPMMEMNTTPLIDVLLVLLVMLIITIPIQSHAVKLDLPGRPPAPMPRIPELHLRPDPLARYEVVDEVLAIIKREQVKKVGFVGNEAYAHW